MSVGGLASIGYVNFKTSPFTLFENSVKIPLGSKHGFSFSYFTFASGLVGDLDLERYF